METVHEKDAFLEFPGLLDASSQLYSMSFVHAGWRKLLAHLDSKVYQEYAYSSELADLEIGMVDGMCWGDSFKPAMGRLWDDHFWASGYPQKIL